MLNLGANRIWWWVPIISIVGPTRGLETVSFIDNKLCCVRPFLTCALHKYEESSITTTKFDSLNQDSFYRLVLPMTLQSKIPNNFVLYQFTIAVCNACKLMTINLMKSNLPKEQLNIFLFTFSILVNLCFLRYIDLLMHLITVLFILIFF
jgi:hypothetical protein